MSVDESGESVKGIILAGGSGTRLHPITKVVCKQLLPIFDKPMIYYPLTTLMFAGIRDILIICNPCDRSAFEELLGDGHQFGLRLSYEVQERPEGIAQAFLIAAKFLQGASKCMMVLGDNLLYGTGLRETLKAAIGRNAGATLFSYHVPDPERYGVVEMDGEGRVLSLEEKPTAPKSSFAAIGMYIYDSDVVDMARKVSPSARGELEITDLNRLYLGVDSLSCVSFSRGFYWMDTGTPESLEEASNFVRIVQDRIGYKIGCPEEVAYRQSWITKDQLMEAGTQYAKNSYGQYLLDIAR